MGFVKRMFGRVKDAFKGKRELQKSTLPIKEVTKTAEWVPTHRRHYHGNTRRVTCMKCGGHNGGKTTMRCNQCGGYRFHPALSSRQHWHAACTY